jgi:hypothetical protein
VLDPTELARAGTLTLGRVAAAESAAEAGRATVDLAGVAAVSAANEAFRAAMERAARLEAEAQSAEEEHSARRREAVADLGIRRQRLERAALLAENSGSAGKILAESWARVARSPASDSGSRPAVEVAEELLEAGNGALEKLEGLEAELRGWYAARRRRRVAIVIFAVGTLAIGAVILGLIAWNIAAMRHASEVDEALTVALAQVGKDDAAAMKALTPILAEAAVLSPARRKAANEGCSAATRALAATSVEARHYATALVELEAAPASCGVASFVPAITNLWYQELRAGTPTWDELNADERRVGYSELIRVGLGHVGADPEASPMVTAWFYAAGGVFEASGSGTAYGKKGTFFKDNYTVVTTVTRFTWRPPRMVIVEGRHELNGTSSVNLSCTPQLHFALSDAAGVMPGVCTGSYTIQQGANAFRMTFPGELDTASTALRGGTNMGAVNIALARYIGPAEGAAVPSSAPAPYVAPVSARKRKKR